MWNRLRSCSVAAVVLLIWVSVLSGCGPSSGTGVSLRIRFAETRQAVTGPRGLPLGMRYFQVVAYEDRVNGSLAGQTGCVEINPDEPSTTSISLDVFAGSDRILVASGFREGGCNGDAAWLGMAVGVDVPEGQEIEVPIFVTERGETLNQIPETLDPPRAFASATRLGDGRVLIAGGYVLESSNENGLVLKASSDGLIYDPGRATLTKTGSLSESRGGHQALTLSNGSVLLVGGSKRIVVNYLQDSLFEVNFSEAMSTADVYDPASGTFTRLGPEPLLARIQPAVMVLPGDKIVLMGGETTVPATDDIVIGLKSGEGRWDWSKLTSTSLSVPRDGARAAALDTGILVAGGSLDGSNQVEIRDESNFALKEVLLSIETELPVGGHSLTRVNETRALLAGGLTGSIGDPPSGALIDMTFGASVPVVHELTLSHPRAYHSHQTMQDGRILFAAGLDGQNDFADDIELFRPGQPASQTVDNQFLETGSIGVVTVLLPDGSVLFAGGIGRNPDGSLMLSSVIELFSP